MPIIHLLFIAWSSIKVTRGYPCPSRGERLRRWKKILLGQGANPYLTLPKQDIQYVYENIKFKLKKH